MSFLTYAIAAKLERGTHLLDTLVSKQDIPKDQLERDLNTLQFDPSTLLKAELIECDFHKAVDVLFTKRLVARGNASYGVEIEGEERVIESLKLVHQVTNDDIYQSGLQSLAHHLGSRKLIETTNAVVLGGDIELTDAEYDLEKPYTDETIASILELTETAEKAEDASNVSESETSDEQEIVDGHELVDETTTDDASKVADEHEITDEHVTVDESGHVIEDATVDKSETVEESENVDEQKMEPEQNVVESVALSEVVTDITVTPSETATEAATKEFPFSDDELTELAKGVIERGNKLATEVPDFGHSETSDVLAVLDDSTDELTSSEADASELDAHASEQANIEKISAVADASEDAHVSEQATSDVSEAEALNHMIDEISTDLKTSEKSEVNVTASEGPSADGVANAVGSLDVNSMLSGLERLHEVGKPITSQFAR